MDRQLKLAKISKFAYKVYYKARLYRFDTLKKNPAKARKVRKKLEKFISADDRIVVLPKNNVIINQKIEAPEDALLPTKVIDHFIDQSTYRAIMNYCICRDSNSCKNYPTDFGCLYLGEAARDIHPEISRPATKEEAKKIALRCREAGLVHLVGRAKLDAIWLGVSPHNRLFTICNCCPCCCVALARPYIAPELTDWFYKMPGVKITVNEDCVGCETCQDVCIFGGLKMNGGQAAITDRCLACGRCAEVCPQNAIQIHMDKKYIQKSIDFLAPVVDVT